MKFYCDLYLTEEYRVQKGKIIRNLNKKRIGLEQYLIVLANNTNNHLELFHGIHLKQDIFMKEDLLIVGVAKGRNEAFQLVQFITQDIYDKTNTTNIRNYIINRQKEYEEGTKKV